ncbi:hypothetical protein [Burkholderia cenocepacia]|uniref:hypothetical protein n=1 Tax=Burkholderia cenocepacia TaxID=95486 RepID=UPI002B23F1E1|nr:hypothetical protein [Burkholderia cenocepacia]MEB2554073.1 hypothetical protein [Burkholderia cenocepacia]
MNCKPGDLAIIIFDEEEENLGLIVEVIGPARFLTSDDWMIVSTGRPMKCIDFETGSRFHAQDGDISDAYLRPVSGLPITDDVTDGVTA